MYRPGLPVSLVGFRSARDRSVRFGALALGLAVAASLAPSGPAFGQKAAAKGREIEEKTLTSTDGRWSLAITYYKSSKGKESPVVILLHQDRSSKIAWKNGFAERLQDEGYAVVAVDLRKFGLSAFIGTDPGSDKKPSALDYAAMVGSDLEAVKAFLLEENEKQALNVRKTAIVAPGMSAPIAVNFAANDWVKTPFDDAPSFDARTPRGQDIRALILLSPEKNLPKMVPDKGLQFLRKEELQVAMFIGYGDKDKRGTASADDYYKTLTTGADKKPERFLKQPYVANAVGTDMLGRNLKVEEHMIGFLKKYLMDLNGANDAWRSRKSRLASK
jgi:pimeloyl-ACP methyl ester carboxylesterase